MSDNNNITSTIRSYEDESTNPRRDIDQANLSGFRSDKTSQATLTEQKPSELVEQRLLGTEAPLPSPEVTEQFLQYGDIIQIYTDNPQTSPVAEPPSKLVVKRLEAPCQNPLHEKTFLVDYLDDDKIRMINTTTMDHVLLPLNESGKLIDPSIRRIELLTRAQEPGYARQKGLTVDKWVDVYFVGIDSPITGKITHLEEDQIELTIHPSQEIIYIDFRYRGIPDDLGIEKFIIRSSPPTNISVAVEPTESSISEASIEYTAENEAIVRLPEKIVYDTTIDEELRQEYLEANEIIFGKDQDVIEQFVELTTHEKVFSLESQLTSLMNELLSDIPNSKRTHEKMNEIHLLLERFKELREQFSKMDILTNQVLGYTQNGLTHKPLLDALQSPSLNFAPLSWMIPVAQSRRKMYRMPDDDQLELEEMGDTVLQNKNPDQKELSDLMTGKIRGGNVNPYLWMIQEVDPYFVPTVDTPVDTWSDYVTRKSVLFQQPVGIDGWESIIDNTVDREYTASSASAIAGSRTHIKPVKFFTQRNTLGTSFLERSESNRRVFVPTIVTPTDTINIQSWITLPYSIARFSRIRLHSLDIQQRANMSQNYWMKYRTFPTRRDTSSLLGNPDTFTVEDWTTNYFATMSTKKDKEQDLTKTTVTNFMRGVKHYIIDPALVRENDQQSQTSKLVVEGLRPSDKETYEAYMNSITPSTFDLIELIQPHMNSFQGFSIKEVVSFLEPFLIYTNDLTYTHLNRIRFFIRQRILQYRKQFQDDHDKYVKIESAFIRITKPLDDLINSVHNILEIGSNYDSHFMEVYRIPALIQKKEGRRYMSSTELLKELLERDTSKLFTMLLRSRMVSNVISDTILSSALEDYDEEEKRLSKQNKSTNDCNRLFLTKRYTTLADLQKDNHKDDVFYDKDFDDTPYQLLDIYKKDMPEQVDMDSPEMKGFLELLEENLIKKHACDRSMATELASNLVSKKKSVREGEYALLEIAEPVEIIQDTDETKTKSFIPVREFYKRIKNQWIKDQSVQEESFADMSYLVDAAFPKRRSDKNTNAGINSMVCNLDNKCVKRPHMAVCDSMENAQEDMKRIRQKYAVEELEKRMQMTQKELEEWIKDHIVEYSRKLVYTDRFKQIQLYKQSLLAVQLGKIQIENQHATPSVSPYLSLFQTIMSQADFYKKQYDLVRFVKKGLVRKAMIEELNEDSHWLYCTQTNTKIVPIFLYELALEYITKGENGYQEKLEEMKQFQVISDDGDSIVDKHSGFVISKIEWVREELYDEHGFKIKTSSVLDKEEAPFHADDDSDENPANVLDTGTINVESGNGLSAYSLLTSEATMSPEKFDDSVQKHVDMVRNIFISYCRILEISAREYEQGFQEFVARVSLELIQQTLMSKEAFTTTQSKKMEASKIPERYQKYYHQYLIIITTSVFLIGIQTAIPRIQTKKTVPGCVRSFSGYPLTESTDDKSGIEYMACILNIVKSSIPPWDSIQKADRKDIILKIQEKISDILDKRKDIYELYLKEREYRITHPEEFAIPLEHQLDKWRGLYPPIVNIDVISRLPVERTDGIPPTSIIAQSKAIMYGCGVIEAIHTIVQEKDVLLKSSLGIPFVQNACCNESSQGDSNLRTTLNYFIKQNPLIGTYMNHIDFYGKTLTQFLQHGRSSIWVSTVDTRIPRHSVISGNLEELVYHSFIHHCQFDRTDMEIPEHLRAICSTKPADEKYNRKGTLREKIQALKNAGKVYHLEDFERLIRSVNASNMVNTDLKVITRTAVQLLTDFLSGSEGRMPSTTNSEGGFATGRVWTESSSVIDVIRQELLAVLIKYDPQIMVMEKQAVLIKYDPQLMAMGNPQENDELHVAVMKLKNKLAKENDSMKIRIVQFLKDYGGLKRSDLDKIKETVVNLPIWSCQTSPATVTGKGHTERVASSLLTSKVALPPEKFGCGEEMYEMGQFIRNSTIAMVKVIPEMILNKQLHQEPVLHQHWGLAESHLQILRDLIQQYWIQYAKFTNDNSPDFNNLLRGVQGKLIDLVVLSQLIPIQRTIQRGNETWFRLFDRSTLSLLMSYIWYSVLDQYINTCNEFAKTKNTFIMVAENMKKQVATLLLTFIRTLQKDKQQIDQSYESIMKKVNRAKDKEKEKIMSDFEQADKKDRRYMFLEKMWKHGRWNVGIQNGLVKYDKARFEYERLTTDMEIDAEETPTTEIQFVNPGDGDGDDEHEENDIHDLEDDHRDNRDVYGSDDESDFEDS